MQEMTAREQSRWVIVGVAFVTLFFIWGALNAGGVFFLPVLKTFGWSRAQLAALGGLGALAAGVVGPLIGWLVDRAGVRTMMIGGATVIVICYAALSRANSFAQFAAIAAVGGVAGAAATIIPCSIAIADGFSSERGLAMGIAFTGIPLGGTVITILANYVVQHHGWRVGYLAMGLPVAVIVLPAIAGYVPARPRTTPQVAAMAQGAQTPPQLPGLDIHEALGSRSFWMIALAQLMFTTAWIGLGVHFIPYLIGVGYSPGSAATIVSVGFVLSAAGTFSAGLVADRLNGRLAMALACVCAAGGIVALFAAGRTSALAAYLILFPTVAGTPAVLIPLLIADSLGLRQLGAMLGIEGIFSTIGFAMGPIIAGRIYDVTHSYSGALWLFIVLSVGSAAAILGCRPLAREQSLGAVPAAVPAA
jgi:MFS family permease